MQPVVMAPKNLHQALQITKKIESESEPRPYKNRTEPYAKREEKPEKNMIACTFNEIDG